MVQSSLNASSLAPGNMPLLLTDNVTVFVSVAEAAPRMVPLSAHPEMLQAQQHLIRMMLGSPKMIDSLHSNEAENVKVTLYVFVIAVAVDCEYVTVSVSVSTAELGPTCCTEESQGTGILPNVMKPCRLVQVAWTLAAESAQASKHPPSTGQMRVLSAAAMCTERARKWR